MSLSALPPYDNTLDQLPAETWPTWAVYYIMDYYGERGDKEIAADLTADVRAARTYTAKHVEKKRESLGLKRNLEQRATVQRRNTASGSYRRPTGFVSTRAVTDGDIRTWNERLPDGSTRQSLRIKQGGRMVALSKHVWEQEFGPVPAGYIVTFRDGDSLNCDPSNLLVMTRAENIERNRNLEKGLKAQRENHESRAARQHAHYLTLQKQLDALQLRIDSYRQGGMDERLKVDMIEQIVRELTKRQNGVRLEMYRLPESAKKPAPGSGAAAG